MIPLVSADTIAATLRSVLSPSAFAPPGVDLTAESYFVTRQGGVALRSDWYRGTDLGSVLKGLTLRSPDADAIEICLGTTRTVVPRAEWATAMQNRNRGRFGLEFTLGSRTFRIAPTQTIATNRPLTREFQRFLEALGIDEERYVAEGGSVVRLGFRQFLVSLSGQVTCTEMYRGNTIVSAEGIADVDVDPVLRDMLTWFQSNQGPDGALPYKYWPSSGVEADSDNTIRRFMATSAFAQLGKRYESPEVADAAVRNLRFNLARFYRQERNLGLIEWDESVKLGAVALAGLAILNCEAQDEFAATLEALINMVFHLRNSDGSFRSFYIPANRNDNQNFYPGEALLFLSTLRSSTGASDMDEAILQSLRWYRGFFRKNPNPAFVPWHIQACLEYMKGELVDDLVAYVFEMSDWLLPMQQWGAPLDPDLWGRFYNPSRPEYGPPHASSTGVFLEGLCDALVLAKRVGDEERANAYLTVIQRGIRSIRQLQFKTPQDMYYVSKKSQVFGGIRTECYDNEVRMDNVQHCAMALMKYAALTHRSAA